MPPHPPPPKKLKKHYLKHLMRPFESIFSLYAFSTVIITNLLPELLNDKSRYRHFKVLSGVASKLPPAPPALHLCVSFSSTHIDLKRLTGVLRENHVQYFTWVWYIFAFSFRFLSKSWNFHFSFETLHVFFHPGSRFTDYKKSGLKFPHLSSITPAPPPPYIPPPLLPSQYFCKCKIRDTNLQTAQNGSSSFRSPAFSRSTGGSFRSPSPFSLCRGTYLPKFGVSTAPPPPPGGGGGY